MYEEIVAAARRSTEAAVQESHERVQMAVSKSEAADKKAAEASKTVGDRWTNRINAMRRRAAERTAPGGEKSTEMSFGHEDGPHPNDQVEGDELVSLTDTPAAASPNDNTPPLGIPQEDLQQQQAVASYGRHASEPTADRFYSTLGTPAQDEEPPVAFQPPPARRQPPPSPRRARRTEDEDDDYSGQSWLEGR